jgi:isopenicillin N synthase-like dioxygenase
LFNVCSETLEKYVTKSREVIGELLKAISLTLSLEENYIQNMMNVESGSQILVINYYPPCPKPELVMGLPAHTDHGLLTLLMQNELGGLQIEHDGKWIPINPLPNSFLINTGDHLEVKLKLHTCKDFILCLVSLYKYQNLI